MLFHIGMVFSKIFMFFKGLGLKKGRLFPTAPTFL